jgi:hypothetical protein
MGTQRETGYSADVEAFFVVEGGDRLRLAKSNGSAFYLAEPCELAPGTIGQLLVIIDGQPSSRLVTLPDGIAKGQTKVNYEVAAPF